MKVQLTPDQFEEACDMVRIMLPEEYECYMKQDICNGDFWKVREAFWYSGLLIKAGYRKEDDNE